MSASDPRESAQLGERMIDAKAAAAALRLPYYWFADPLMRERHRIPHYVLGRSVRYRLSHLLVWAARSGRTTDPLDAEAPR